MDPLFFEFVVSQFLSATKDVLVRKLRRGPDFDLKKADGSRVLIEVKTGFPDRVNLERLSKQVTSYEESADKFLLVTPTAPPKKLATAFDSVFSGSKVLAKWISLNDLPSELDVPTPGDLTSPDTLAQLQLESLLENVHLYAMAPIGPGPEIQTKKGITKEFLPLTRQFSHHAIAALSRGPQAIEEQLKIAERTENVTVVLSDVVNFSSLVSASRPEELKDSMNRYYRLAREAVFTHRGMLDKFIGDAVLAVFGYPIPGPADAINALKFSQDLIEIGKDILVSWQEDLNAVIETGTRVGVATGDLWPINIGTNEVEVTLLGDTINLTARLEKNCQRNNILIDNRTKSKASKEDVEYVTSLDLTQVQIPPSEAKGQQFTIRAWTRDNPSAEG